MSWEIHIGDCIEEMRKLEENSVDAVVTDPPYGIGFMGHEWGGSMKPVLLDLFCGAGGVAEGLKQAGFEVVGVDVEPMSNFAGDFFIQMDALHFLIRLLAGEEVKGFRLKDFVHISASPPCPAYADVTRWRGDQDDHPRLVAAVRWLLEQTGLPYTIENVRNAPLRACLMLCGTMFGLRVQRHRYFETNWLDPTRTWGTVPPCNHHPDDYSFDHGAKQPESVYRDAMGCGWMTVAESRQAIPPAYSKFIGEQLIQHLAHQPQQEGAIAAPEGAAQ